MAVSEITVKDADDVDRIVAVPEVRHVIVDSGALPTGAATQTTLAAVLAKIIAAPSTEAKQDAIVTALGLLGTQTTSAAILAKLSADPATQTTLAAILAKIIAAPATEAKQDTANTALGTLATQTTAAAILAKIIAAPSTEAKQDSAIVQETAINTVLGTTAGAAVTTNATGTIQQYLRGIVSLLVSGITVATHAVTGTVTANAGTNLNTSALATSAQIGEVQTSPTANTVLDRLKAIATAITAATVGSTAPGTDAAQMVGMQGAAGMVPVATVGKTAVFDVTLVLDTGIYAAGDLLVVTQQLNGILRVADGTGVIQSIQVIDQDDQGAALDIYLLSANVSMGTINAAPSITDANAVNLHGPISVATTDYKDLGGAKVANIRNIGLPVKAVSTTDDLYIAVVNGAGTPTYTAAGIKLRIGVLLD